MQRARPASHAHFRHRHISVTDTFLNPELICESSSSIDKTATNGIRIAPTVFKYFSQYSKIRLQPSCSQMRAEFAVCRGRRLALFKNLAVPDTNATV